MLTGTTIFTGLIDTADVTATIVQYGYLFAGLIIIMFVLSPLFISKAGFKWILSKVSGLFGSR